MCAALQSHGRTWSPPNPEGMRKWDRIFYYDQGLDPIIIYDSRFDHVFSPGRRTIIDKAGQAATNVIDASWEAGTTQVVHGDLHEWNVHTDAHPALRVRLRGRDDRPPRPGRLGVPLFVAHERSDLPRSRPHFARAIEEIAPWPIEDHEQLDGFHAARQVMLMNYAARTLPMGETEQYPVPGHALARQVRRPIRLR